MSKSFPPWNTGTTFPFPVMYIDLNGETTTKQLQQKKCIWGNFWHDKKGREKSIGLIWGKVTENVEKIWMWLIWRCMVIISEYDTAIYICLNIVKGLTCIRQCLVLSYIELIKWKSAHMQEGKWTVAQITTSLQAELLTLMLWLLPSCP